MIKMVFLLIVFVLFVWRIKKGFHNGITKEVVTILSGVVSLVCVALVFFAVSSYMAKAMSALTVCVAGLILLGIAFKLCSLMFKPLLALSNISVIGWLDKFMGAVMGAVEACMLSYGTYYIFERIGICVV